MPPRQRKAQPKTNTLPLLAALKFISVAQKEEGNFQETHCILANKQAVAFNGTISAGIAIEEDISVCPHTLKLVAALSRCSESLAITQLDNFKLSVKSENFRAMVSCADPTTMNWTTPDAPVAVISDKIKEGFAILAQLISNNSEHVVTGSCLLRSNSMISTNRHVMFEYWHGFHLPGKFPIPKAAVLAVAKSGKELVKLGASQNTVTFWFSDDSWIKTQRYNYEWPNVDKVLNLPSAPQEIPLTLFKGIEALAPFAEGERLIINEGRLTVKDDMATYDVAGLPKGISVNLKYMQMIEPIATTIDFNVSQKYIYFFGENVRGVIVGMV